jgi:hypothetical protein
MIFLVVLLSSKTQKEKEKANTSSTYLGAAQGLGNLDLDLRP